jgi:chemotaxis regulatin CheY-phosphate phosphatase CheZ
MDKSLTITDEDYLSLEDALCANARGRAFLRMRDHRASVIAADEVKRLMRSLRNSAKRTAPSDVIGNSTHLRILRHELQEMSGCIQQTRNEVAALRPDDTGNNRIISATGELDAIITATERATGEILNSAERILALAARLPKTPDCKSIIEDIEAQGIEILTACSFQDITGQRTTKVVNTLHYLEKRVNSMIGIWGVDGANSSPIADEIDRRPDAHLLNGPSAQGVSQADVDALMSGFHSVAPEALAPAALPKAIAPAAAPPPVVVPHIAPGVPVVAAAPVAPIVIVAPVAPAAPIIKAAMPAAPPPTGGAFNQNDIDALFD